MHLTASVPSGGRASNSSSEACTAWTACMLELMVPVKACWADVCNRNRKRTHLTEQPKPTSHTRDRKSDYNNKPSEQRRSWNTVVYSLVYKCVYLTRGGMCPLCICPLVVCCLAWGMEPIWKLSGPPAPERMMAGRATEPVSTFPTLLNCCWRTVDLRHNTIRSNATTET